jgi:hypothetical protein
MTKPILDKAQADKIFIGTFGRSAQFDAHLDKTGISLTLQRAGDVEARRSIRMHLHYGLFAEILRELAKMASAIPEDDAEHRNILQDAVKALHRSLAAKSVKGSRRPGKNENHKPGHKDELDTTEMTPEEEVLLLHVIE